MLISLNEMDLKSHWLTKTLTNKQTNLELKGGVQKLKA